MATSGTSPWMPPEALGGFHGDGRTLFYVPMHASFDVYSLGLVALQLLTGSDLPFACSEMTFANRQHTPDTMAKKIIGNFLKVHQARADAADEPTKEYFETTISGLYVSTQLYFF
ncbi:unnamed protein product [Laminaria digitata]